MTKPDYKEDIDNLGMGRRHAKDIEAALLRAHAAGLWEASEISRLHAHIDTAGNEVLSDECSCEDRIADAIVLRFKEVEGR